MWKKTRFGRLYLLKSSVVASRKIWKDNWLSVFIGVLWINEEHEGEQKEQEQGNQYMTCMYVMYALHVQKTELTKKKFTTQHSSITSSYTRTRSEKVQISGIIICIHV